MAKIITISGIEKCDFTYYLSEILKKQGNTVVVVDNSMEGDLWNSVQKNYTTTPQPYKISNIGYLRNVEINLDAVDEIDYLICYLGYNACTDFLQCSDIVFLMPGYTMKSIQACKEMMEDIAEKTNTQVILREYANPKITDKSVAQALGLRMEEIAGHISLDVQDYSLYYALLYNGAQSPKYVSSDMKEALTYAMQVITDANPKELRKMMKKAM